MFKQVLEFTRQMALLLRSGVPILKSLEITEAQLPKGAFKKIVQSIVADIQEGLFFSEAIAKHKCFTPLYVNMVKAGEISGNFSPALRQLADFLIRSKRLRSSVTSAIMYPALILVTSIMILAVLLTFVVPTFTRIFADLGGDLPVITKCLIVFGDVMGKWGWLLFVAMGLTVFFFGLYSRTKKGAFALNNLIWRLPLFGELTKNVALERFCRCLGVMLDSGVDLVKSLEATREVLVQPVLKKALTSILDEVQEGTSLSLAMEHVSMFPLSLVRIIGVAEESGSLSKTFMEVASDYEDEVNMAITGMLSLLEPIMIVVMGGIIGFVVIGLFMPIFLMGSMVQK
jgi:type II secretory pathway component PulF